MILLLGHPFALLPIRDAIQRRPAEAAAVPRPELLSVHHRPKIEVKIHRVVRDLPLPFLRGEFPPLRQTGTPRLPEGPHPSGFDLHPYVRHQPPAAGVYRRNVEKAPLPEKGFAHRKLLSRSALASALPEAAPIVDHPLWGVRWSGGLRLPRQLVIFFAEFQRAVIKAGLHPLEIPVGVVHGREPQRLPKPVQHGPLLRPGRVRLQIGVELPPVPHPRLLQGVHAAAGQHQPQEVLEAPGQGMDIVPRPVGGADGKHRLPEALHKAEVDAVHPRPADGLRPHGVAEVAAPGVSPLQPDLGEIQLQAAAAFIQCHAVPSTSNSLRDSSP